MQRLLERRHAGVRPRSRVRAFQRRRRPASSGVVAVLNDEGPVGGQTTRCAALFCVHRVDFDVVTVQVPRSKVPLEPPVLFVFFVVSLSPKFSVVPSSSSCLTGLYLLVRMATRFAACSRYFLAD